MTIWFQLTAAGNDLILVNMLQIVYIERDHYAGGSLLRMADGNKLQVQDQYDDIHARLKKAETP